MAPEQLKQLRSTARADVFAPAWCSRGATGQRPFPIRRDRCSRSCSAMSRPVEPVAGRAGELDAVGSTRGARRRRFQTAAAVQQACIRRCRPRRHARWRASWNAGRAVLAHRRAELLRALGARREHRADPPRRQRWSPAGRRDHTTRTEPRPAATVAPAARRDSPARVARLVRRRSRRWSASLWSPSRQRRGPEAPPTPPRAGVASHTAPPPR